MTGTVAVTVTTCAAAEPAKSAMASRVKRMLVVKLGVFWLGCRLGKVVLESTAPFK